MSDTPPTCDACNGKGGWSAVSHAIRGNSMSNETLGTLGDALPKEIARVRDEVMPIYQQIPTGALAVLMMKRDLADASAAIADQDTVGMLRAYQALKGYKT